MQSVEKAFGRNVVGVAIVTLAFALVAQVLVVPALWHKGGSGVALMTSEKIARLPRGRDRSTYWALAIKPQVSDAYRSSRMLVTPQNVEMIPLDQLAEVRNWQRNVEISNPHASGHSTLIPLGRALERANAAHVTLASLSSALIER